MPSLPSRRARGKHSADGREHLPFSALPTFDPDSLPSDCRSVPLGNGGYTLVDEEDYHRVAGHTWYKWYNESGRTWYARASMGPKGATRQVLMHRFLFGLDPGDRVTVDHENHDGLDNRRSHNLRLASRAQNVANQRKLKEAKSRYRGVGWNSSTKKWIVKIQLTTNGVKKSIGIGRYDVEEEAAFAFQVAAPLLKDPEFLRLDPIPEDRLPDASRRAEIKAAVIARIKAILAGEKGKLDATSRYYGVCYIPRDGQWRAFPKIGDRYAYLGLYATEKEAAYAYNHAVTTLKLTGRKLNGVTEADLGDPARAAEIRTEVAERIEAFFTGAKVGKATSSRYRGACLIKADGKWASTITHNKRIVLLARFATEIEAAVAYNIAASILNSPRLKPNPIPPEDMPSPETVEAIRCRVAARLAALSA